MFLVRPTVANYPAGVRPARPLEPTPKTVELRGGPVSFTDTGAGRVVIAVHGMPASGWDFRWFDAALAGRARLLRVDLPGFGASPAGTHDSQSVAGMARVVVELCEALGVEDAVALGHSMGGPIALHATAATERISGLALVCSPGPVWHRGIFPRTYRALCALIDLFPPSRRPLLVVAKPILRAVGFSQRLADDELVLAARVCGSYEPGATRTALSHLDKPVLVVWTVDDRAVEVAVSEALVSCVAKPKRVRFETGGHNPQSTRAVELADALVEWIGASAPATTRGWRR